PGAEIDQPLDVHRHFAAQIALDRNAGHLLAQLVELVVREILDLARAADARSVAYDARARASDAEDRGERDLRVLLVRDVHSADPGHACPSLCREEKVCDCSA